MNSIILLNGRIRYYLLEGTQLTRVEMNKISVEALVAGGADRDIARSIVAKSQLDLKNKGVRHPTDLPWGKRDKK